MASVFLVAEADGTIGFGHLSQMRALWRALQALGVEAELLAVGPRPPDPPWQMSRWFQDVESAARWVVASSSAVTVWNVRRPLTPQAQELFRTLAGRKVWVADQPATPPPVDLLIVPSVVRRWHQQPQGAARVLFGPAYIPLDPVYESSPPPLEGRTDEVLLTLGGADQTGATLHILLALAGRRATVVIGPAFRARPQIRDAATAYGVRWVEAPERLDELLRSHRLVLSSGGDTLYEAAASGTPAWVAWEDPHEEEQAQAFVEAGTARVLGQGIALNRTVVLEAIETALSSATLLDAMARAGRALVDGHGAHRMAQAIMALDCTRDPQGAAVSLHQTDRAAEVPHSKPSLGQAEWEAVRSVLASGYLTQGPVVRQLEASWCRHTTMAFAACTGSGLGALRLSLVALEVNTGDEVIVPAYSCVALLNAILAVGGTPVLADVTQDAWTLAVADVRRRMTSRTTAIVAVHLFGMPAELPSLVSLGLPVIEDCAHGIGGRCGGKPFGSSGTLNIASFYGTKLLAGGEGGIVAGHDVGLIQRVRRVRDYGDQEANALHVNDKMTEIEAALVGAQLARLPELLTRRAERAARYQAALSVLSDDGVVVLPPDVPGRIWYRYPVRLVDHDARAVCRWMVAHGVRAEQPVWDLRTSRFWSPELPMTAEAFDRLVSLPLYPDLAEAQQERVVETFRQCLAHLSPTLGLTTVGVHR